MSTPYWLQSVLGTRVPLLLQLSMEAALLVLVVQAVILALRRNLPAASRHWLWLLVFVRLMLPSLAIVPVPAVPVMTSPAVEEAAPVSDVEATTSSTPEKAQLSAATISAISVETPPAAQSPRSAASKASVKSVWPFVVTVWWLGVVSMLSIGMVRSTNLHRKLRRASSPASAEVEALLRHVGRDCGLRRVPRVMTCTAVQVPALAGWLRPCILLPEGFATQMPEDRLRLVLGHELAHWRRHDLWWQLMTSLLLALHWFNPLLWLARFRLHEESEAACDEWLLARISQDQVRTYGDTLLQLSACVSTNPDRWMPRAQGLLGMSVAASSLRRRILLVTDWMGGKRARRLGGYTAFVVVAALGFLRAAEPKAAPAPASAPLPPLPKWSDRVQFHVFDDVSKAPLPDVKLSVISEKFTHESTTDTQGLATVQLPAVRPAYATVKVRMAGRVPLAVYWHFDQPTFFPPDVLELPLPKAASVGGVVQDNDGKSVANAQVALIMRGSNMGGSTQEIFPDVWERRVPTDAEGRWHFDEAPPNRKNFSIAVEHPDVIREKFSVRDSETAPFYEGRGVTKVKRGVKISGSVVDESGQPVKARLVLGEAGSDSTTYPEYATDDQGQFVMTNAPQDWQLLVTVWSKDHAPAVLFWNVPKLQQPVTIRMNTGKTLRVRVLDDAGNPVPGVIAAADEWHGPGADARGLRVMLKRFRTNKEGRFTWAHAPPEPVSWDFGGGAGFRDSRDVRLTPGDEELVVKMAPLFRVAGAVTDADTGAPVAEFKITPGARWDFEGWQDAGHRGWMWSSTSTLVGKDGRLFYQSDDSRNPTMHRVLRVSAPGYAPVISEAFMDDSASHTWDVALKRSPPVHLRVEQPDGRPAAGAKLSWNHVRNGKVRVKGGDLPWLEGPEGNGIFYPANADGVATVPPEMDEFHLVAVHASGWARMLHGDLRENAVLKLQPWAGVEIDVSGLPAELRPKISTTFWTVVLDSQIIEQQVEDMKMTSTTEALRDDHLISGLYKLQLVCGQMFTTPLAVQLAPGEHRKIDAAKLFQWCKPVAPLEVPQGASLGEKHDLKIVQTVDLQGSKVSDKQLASITGLTNVSPRSKRADTGGWELHLSLFGLGAGTYHLTGTLKGWPAGAETTGPASDIGKIDHTFTIPQSAVGNPVIRFEDNPENPGRPQMKVEGLPSYELPPIKVT